MNHVSTFCTGYHYIDRETKAKYVWLKYRSILKGRILDVGADMVYLKQHLPGNGDYFGIGLGGSPDQEVDLEKNQIPFPDGSFDCVLCLDVLEHVDNIHEVFDELCRVTKRYVVISLPNPWQDFWNMLRSREYRPGQPMKFYGLPLEPPEDRHKWFFSNEEGEKFILYRAAKSGMKVIQVDNCGIPDKRRGWRRLLRVLAARVLLRKGFDLKNLNAGTLWAVLQKENWG